MLDNPPKFEAELRTADAAVRGMRSEIAKQYISNQIETAPDTNVSRGLETGQDRLVQVLERLAPPPARLGNALDKAMKRASEEPQDAASIKRSIAAQEPTSTERGLTMNGRPTSAHIASGQEARARALQLMKRSDLIGPPRSFN